jgi:hypothetical protein
MLLDPVDQAAEHVEAEECPVTSVRPDSKPIVELVRKRQQLRFFVVAHTIKLAGAPRSRCRANLRLTRPARGSHASVGTPPRDAVLNAKAP